MDFDVQAGRVRAKLDGNTLVEALGALGHPASTAIVARAHEEFGGQAGVDLSALVGFIASKTRPPLDDEEHRALRRLLEDVVRARHHAGETEDEPSRERPTDPEGALPRSGAKLERGRGLGGGSPKRLDLFERARLADATLRGARFATRERGRLGELSAEVALWSLQRAVVEALPGIMNSVAEIWKLPSWHRLSLDRRLVDSQPLHLLREKAIRELVEEADRVLATAAPADGGVSEVEEGVRILQEKRYEALVHEILTAKRADEPGWEWPPDLPEHGVGNEDKRWVVQASVDLKGNVTSPANVDQWPAYCDGHLHGWSDEVQSAETTFRGDSIEDVPRSDDVRGGSFIDESWPDYVSGGEGLLQSHLDWLEYRTEQRVYTHVLVIPGVAGKLGELIAELLEEHRSKILAAARAAVLSQLGGGIGAIAALLQNAVLTEEAVGDTLSDHAGDLFEFVFGSLIDAITHLLGARSAVSQIAHITVYPKGQQPLNIVGLVGDEGTRVLHQPRYTHSDGTESWMPPEEGVSGLTPRHTAGDYRREELEQHVRWWWGAASSPDPIPFHIGFRTSELRSGGAVHWRWAPDDGFGVLVPLLVEISASGEDDGYVIALRSEMLEMDGSLVPESTSE